jgi:hypothetical protein
LTISSNGISQASADVNNTFMGKIGIGTNSPAEKLHVLGNARVDGTHTASAISLGGETRTNWPSGAQGALMASNNLSDIQNAGIARTNLGLGSAAVEDSSAFLAPDGNGSQLTGITASQVGALSTTGGVVNGSISFTSPLGDIPMGVFTNQ